MLLPEPKPPRARAPHYPRSHHRAGSLAPPSTIEEDEENEEDEEDIDVEAQALSRNRSRHARLSMSAQAHQVWMRKKTRRWYAVVAGALAGSLGILCEKKGRRTGIAQQMFVR